MNEVHDIAIVGLGRAGRARARALRSHSRARLAAIVRRTPIAPEWDFAELRRRARDLDAVIVCTPNLAHADQARELLALGLHVAVEFPLAPSESCARELFALAAERERVLHVEHIELLAPAHQALRPLAARLGRPRAGEVRFQGGLDGWIGDAAQAGSPALLASARLHRLVDLFGEAAIRDAALERTARGYRLQVELDFLAGGVATLIEQRAPGLPRATSFALTCEGGLLSEPGGAPRGDLFRLDLDHFLDRIDHDAGATVPPARELHVLTLIGAIELRIA